MKYEIWNALIHGIGERERKKKTEKSGKEVGHSHLGTLLIFQKGCNLMEAY